MVCRGGRSLVALIKELLGWREGKGNGRRSLLDSGIVKARYESARGGENSAAAQCRPANRSPLSRTK